MSGRFLAPGRTGAPDRPPALGRVAVDGAVEACEVPDTVRVGRGGDISMADPGLGRDGSMAEPGLAAMAAFLAANMVSRMEGLLVPIVLLENPIPGRTVAGSVRLGAFGLCGSFWSSFCAVESKLSMILEQFVSNEITSVRNVYIINLRICPGRPNLMKFPIRGSHLFSHARIWIIQALFNRGFEHF